MKKKEMMSRVADEALQNEDHILLDVKYQEMGYFEEIAPRRRGESSEMKKRYVRDDGRIAKIYIYGRESYHQIWIEMEAPGRKEQHIHLDDWDNFEAIVDGYHI